MKRLIVPFLPLIADLSGVSAGPGDSGVPKVKVDELGKQLD